MKSWKIEAYLPVKYKAISESGNIFIEPEKSPSVFNYDQFYKYACLIKYAPDLLEILESLLSEVTFNENELCVKIPVDLYEKSFEIVQKAKGQ